MWKIKPLKIIWNKEKQQTKKETQEQTEQQERTWETRKTQDRNGKHLHYKASSQPFGYNLVDIILQQPEEQDHAGAACRATLIGVVLLPCCCVFVCFPTKLTRFHCWFIVGSHPSTFTHWAIGCDFKPDSKKSSERKHNTSTWISEPSHALLRSWTPLSSLRSSALARTSLSGTRRKRFSCPPSTSIALWKELLSLRLGRSIES